MTDLPRLGVGIVYAPGLEPLLEAGRECIDVIEVEPQTLWFKVRSGSDSHSYRLDQRAFDRLAQYSQPKIVHGVGFPVGGSTPPDPGHVAPLNEAIATLRAPWVSEHLSFNRVTGSRGSFGTGFLLPPAQTPAGVAIAVANIRQVSSQLDVPFAFETGVSYLRRHPGEMSDGAYFGAVANAANCGLILDLHNLWTNQRNGRQSVLDVVDEIPLDRVWEVHLGGGNQFNNHWVDAHSGLVPSPVMDLAAQIIPRLPNVKALVFEIVPEYIAATPLSIEDIVEQIWAMQGLWEHRGTLSDRPRNARKEHVGADSASTAQDWEEALGTLAIGGEPEGTLAAWLSADPGIEVYRRLIEAVRAGMVVACLKLTSRYLMLRLGDSDFRQLLGNFWQTVPPELFSADECRNFGHYLQDLRLDFPHLYEILAFELDSLSATVDGISRIARFSCDPRPLLTALGSGRLPEIIISGDFELEVQPSSV